MKKILITTLCSMAFLSCSKTENEKTNLIVGTNPEFAPFEYMEGQEIKGFDIDLMNEIAKKIGKTIDIKSMNFDGLLPALQSKKLDVVIAGMTATEKRKEFVNFTQNYYVSQQALVIKNEKIEKLDELKNNKIGVILGYTGDVYISSQEGFQIERFNSASAAILALQADKIAAVILDEEPAKNYINKNKGLFIISIDGGKEEYAIALHKDETKLLADINKALDEIKTDGTYEKLYKKYFKNKGE